MKWEVHKFIEIRHVVFVMNEFSMKRILLQQMAKLAQNREVIGNSQERKTAPISWRN